MTDSTRTAINDNPDEAVTERAYRFALDAMHLRGCPGGENINYECECGKEEAIDLLRAMSHRCEFCGEPAPEDQFHPYWHNDGAPMVSCDGCMSDREPQPTDGPDYHADHAAWRARNGLSMVPSEPAENGSSPQ